MNRNPCFGCQNRVRPTKDNLTSCSSFCTAYNDFARNCREENRARARMIQEENDIHAVHCGKTKRIRRQA